MRGGTSLRRGAQLTLGLAVFLTVLVGVGLLVPSHPRLAAVGAVGVLALGIASISPSFIPLLCIPLLILVARVSVGGIQLSVSDVALAAATVPALAFGQRPVLHPHADPAVAQRRLPVRDPLHRREQRVHGERGGMGPCLVPHLGGTRRGVDGRTGRCRTARTDAPHGLDPPARPRHPRPGDPAVRHRRLQRGLRDVAVRHAQELRRDDLRHRSHHRLCAPGVDAMASQARTTRCSPSSSRPSSSPSPGRLSSASSPRSSSSCCAPEATGDAPSSCCCSPCRHWLGVTLMVRDQVRSGNQFNSVFQRLNWFQDSLSVWGTDPWFGAGLRWWYTDRFAVRFQPPNAEIEVLTTAGVVGLAAFLVMIVGALVVAGQDGPPVRDARSRRARLPTRPDPVRPLLGRVAGIDPVGRRRHLSRDAGPCGGRGAAHRVGEVGQGSYHRPGADPHSGHPAPAGEGGVGAAAPPVHTAAGPAECAQMSRNRLRIVHVVATDAFAGVERHVARLAASQHDVGHDVVRHRECPDSHGGGARPTGGALRPCDDADGSGSCPGPGRPRRRGQRAHDRSRGGRRTVSRACGGFRSSPPGTSRRVADRRRQQGSSRG